jgi:gas vesicle protein
VLCHPAPALRELIPQGDAEVINDINAAIMPLIERIADKLESTIKEISERVDRQLAEMQQEIRSAARRERSEVLDIPSWRELRTVS